MTRAAKGSGVPLAGPCERAGRALVIAIDGPAASGKGTLARRIADTFGLAHLDTGALYRAVARDVLAAGARLEDEAASVAAARALDWRSLADPRLRDSDVAEGASVVARVSEVRRVLLDFQRAFASRPPGAVLDGRDIGTVVCPQADVKIYVTASPQVRARRRQRELEVAGTTATFDSVLEAIIARDARDASRKDAPMRPARDAILLDTSDLDIEAAFDAAVGLIKRKIGQ